jgi:hypothetical protein
MARLSFPVPIHLTSQKAQGLSNFYVSKTLKCGGVARGALQKPFCSATYNLTDPRSHWLHGHQVVVLVVRYFFFMWSYWKTRVGISWFPGSTGRKAIPQLFWCTVGVVSFTIPYNTRHRATMLLQLKIKDGRTYPGDPKSVFPCCELWPWLKLPTCGRCLPWGGKVRRRLYGMACQWGHFWIPLIQRSLSNNWAPLKSSLIIIFPILYCHIDPYW